MVDIGELVFGALPIPVFLGLIYWSLRLRGSLNRGERMHLKWKDLRALGKVFGVALIMYLAVTVYLVLANILSLTRTMMLPFDGVGDLVKIWMIAIGIVALAYLQSFTNPRKTLRAKSDPSELNTLAP